MELLKQELRKIWNPVILVVLIILGGFYYFLFSGTVIEFFSSGSSSEEAAFSLSAEWSKKYGTTLEPEERAELDTQLAEEKELFAEGLKAFDEPAQYGFYDWDSFMAFRDAYYESTRNSETPGVADMELETVIWKIIGGTNHFTVQTLMGIMESYDRLAQDLPPNLNYDGKPQTDPMYDRIMQRISEIKSSDSVRGYMPTSIYESTNTYLKRFAVWAILSVILLLSPTLVRDKLHRMHSMQWSSKTGRRILNVQYVAAGISALALTIINFAIYAIPFLRCQPLLFKDFKLFSFQLCRIPWFDWTYGQYLLIMSVIIVVLAMAAAGFAVLLSRYSGNYVAMLLKALPLFAILAFISSRYVTNQAFFIGNKASRALGFPGAEFLIVSVLALASVAARVISCSRHIFMLKETDSAWFTNKQIWLKQKWRQYIGKR